MDALELAGSRKYNAIEILAESRRGPMRPDDARFDGITARRPVFEAALARLERNYGRASPAETRRDGQVGSGISVYRAWSQGRSVA